MSWGDVWPFTNFTEFLFNDLQNHNWEIRHGAATALREIILHQGTEGGRTCYASKENQNDQNNLAAVVSILLLGNNSETVHH